VLISLINAHSPTSVPFFPSVAKFSDFAKVTNDFFGKEFPAGQVRVEIKTTAKAPLSGGAVVKPTAFTDVRNGCVSKTLHDRLFFCL
jgi:hypothetical protein